MDHEPLPTPVLSQTPQPASPRYAAAWYPDPTHRFEFRYHNGHDWTGDVSTDGHRYVDPISAQAAGAAPRRDDPATNGSSGSNGKAVGAFVLSLGALFLGWVPFLCAFAVVSGILAVVFGFRSLSEIRRSQRRAGRGFAIAALIIVPFGFAASGMGIWFTAAAIRDFDRFVNIGAYTVTTERCEVTNGVAHFVGSIANDSTEPHAYHVEVEFLRAGTTNVVGSTTLDLPLTESGRSGQWSVAQPVAAEQVDCRVSAVTGPLPFNGL
ncbi:MAG: DUF4190 domain-containing protein [Actinomycetota bacterium]